MNVIWDETAFLTQYPFFQGKITSAQFLTLWKTASTLIDNSEKAKIPYNPEKNIFIREVIIYAVMCHLATLFIWAANGQNNQINSASEGSISVSFNVPSGGGGAMSDWYRQTQCGQQAWALLQQFNRGGRYYPARTFHPWG